MARAIAQHALRPVVGQVYPFAEAPEALRALEAQAVFGNICIGIGEQP
jgi:NADPH:quinone reductase-like Zn-dependent oxidoreductase